MFYCCKRFTCCINRLYFGSDNILINYSCDIGAIYTLIGSLPNNSGKRSSTLHIEKAPLAMNKILSVLTSPIFVLTIVPYKKGSKSL